MKRITIGAVLSACVLAFALGGCAPAQSVDAATLKGFWVLDASAQVGFDAVLNLDEDNVAELMIADSFIEGTWSTDGKQAKIQFADDDAIIEADDTVEVTASGASSAASSEASAAASSEASAASSEASSASASAASSAASGAAASAPAGKTATIFVSDGKLTLGQADGSKLVFTKGDMDAYFAAQDANGTGGQVIDLGDGSDQIVEEKIDDIKPVTVIDDDALTIKVTGKGTDFTGDPGYRLSVENKGKKAIYITADDAFKVGDKSIEAGLGEVVEAGQTVETFMYFPKDDLGGSVEALKNVSGKIILGDDESGDEIKSYDFKMD